MDNNTATIYLAAYYDEFRKSTEDPIKKSIQQWAAVLTLEGPAKLEITHHPGADRPFIGIEVGKLTDVGKCWMYNPSDPVLINAVADWGVLALNIKRRYGVQIPVPNILVYMD